MEPEWEKPELGAGIESGWSPARTKLLRLHFSLGVSAAVSARLIGGVSRNAVISKRRRLGLFGANPLRSLTRLVFGRAPPQVGTFSVPRRGVHPPCRVADAPAIRREPLPFMDWPVPAGGDPKSLAERSPGECAWPLGPAERPGDFRTLFCCAPTKAGRSYCPDHHRRGRTQYIPPALRVEGDVAKSPVARSPADPPKETR